MLRSERVKFNEIKNVDINVIQQFKIKYEEEYIGKVRDL